MVSNCKWGHILLNQHTMQNPCLCPNNYPTIIQCHTYTQPTRSDFSNACFLNSWKLLFADGMGTLFGGPSPSSLGLPRSIRGLEGVSRGRGGELDLLVMEADTDAGVAWCCWDPELEAEAEDDDDAVREERMEAADCFCMVCLGAVTADGTLGGDLTVYPVTIIVYHVAILWIDMTVSRACQLGVKYTEEGPWTETYRSSMILCEVLHSSSAQVRSYLKQIL